MKVPDKIYVREYPDGVARFWEEKKKDDVVATIPHEYIRKDVVDETIKSAEDHAYFAGQEKLREKLLEYVKNKITEAEIALDTADDPAIWGEKNSFKQMFDKLNSM